MNPTNEPNTSTPPPLHPLPADASAAAVIEALLKRPAQLIEALQHAPTLRLPWLLATFALLSFAAYGLVVGSFSGGAQWLAAPLKVSLGALVSMLICLPSLFIFTCLTGAEVTLRGVVGTLCAALALAAFMLIGLVPVVWVFSQSTDALAFIGALHLVFWLIALGIGLRLLRVLMDLLRVRDRLHLKVWTIIFVLVSLQMTTALRPILGTADRWLPQEKKFFAAHWMEHLSPNTPPPAAE